MHRPIPFRPSSEAVSRFLSAERGAVTVEWVVLAAGVTAMCLASLRTQEDGLRVFWYEIGGEMSGSDIVGVNGAVSHFDFADGDAGTWSGASVADIPGFGMALGPIFGSNGLASVTKDFIVARDVAKAVISFDLYGLDSLDAEDAVLYVNGIEVGRVTVDLGTATVKPGTVAGMAMHGTNVSEGTDLGGYINGTAWSKDTITRVTIEVDDPGDAVSFGIGSTADGMRTWDESFAIDNFTFSGSAADAGSGGQPGGPPTS